MARKLGCNDSGTAKQLERTAKAANAYMGPSRKGPHSRLQSSLSAKGQEIIAAAVKPYEVAR